MKRNNDYLKGNKFAKGNKPNKTAFKKGDIPWNKNLKGIHLSPQSEFKKGQDGMNYVPVGTISIRIDKNDKQRRWIKVKEHNIWIEYATFVWIQNGNKIPKGYLIHHKDDDTLNDNIENLAIVDRVEHMNIHRDKLHKARGIL